MSIFNLGSINIDYIYTLPRLLAAGETLASTSFSAALGGKGQISLLPWPEPGQMCAMPDNSMKLIQHG